MIAEPEPVSALCEKHIAERLNEKIYIPNLFTTLSLSNIEVALLALHYSAVFPRILVERNLREFSIALSMISELSSDKSSRL